MELEHANLLLADQNQTIAYLRGFIETRITSSFFLAPSLETMYEQIINLQLRLANLESQAGEHGEEQIAHKHNFAGNSSGDYMITQAATEPASTKHGSINRDRLEDSRSDYIEDLESESTCWDDIGQEVIAESSISETDEGESMGQTENQILTCTLKDEVDKEQVRQKRRRAIRLALERLREVRLTSIEIQGRQVGIPIVSQDGEKFVVPYGSREPLKHLMLHVSQVFCAEAGQIIFKFWQHVVQPSDTFEALVFDRDDCIDVTYTHIYRTDTSRYTGSRKASLETQVIWRRLVN